MSGPTGPTVEPEVSWQIPAVGMSRLSPDEARDLADYLDEHDNDEMMSFILVREAPADVATDLRAAAVRAEERTDKFRARVEEGRR